MTFSIERLGGTHVALLEVVLRERQIGVRDVVALRVALDQAVVDLQQTREDNIKTLALLVKDHPDYKRMDEVLFSLGFSLEEMKQFDRARQVYYRLIKSFPQSDFIPNAYLSFAEYYFQQGDMHAAQQFYQKVTEIPPERNTVYGYALYKQAWCHYNLEDFKGSLQSFVETIEFGTQNPEAPNVENLVEAVAPELVMPYAQVGSPEQRARLLPALREGRRAGLRRCSSRLGELYYDTGEWPEVIAVYHELMAEQFERRQGLLLADARHERDRQRRKPKAAAGHRGRAPDRPVRHLPARASTRKTPRRCASRRPRRCSSTSRPRGTVRRSVPTRSPVPTTAARWSSRRSSTGCCSRSSRTWSRWSSRTSTSATGRPSTRSPTSTPSCSGRWRTGPVRSGVRQGGRGRPAG